MRDRFVCWEPTNESDPGTTPGEASRHIVAAFDPEDAAETYAEREWGNTDPYEKTTIHVRDDSGTVHVVDVYVDYAPQFSGSRRP